MSEAPRVFATGASRNAEAGKLDYEGHLSPEVLTRYCEHMHRHRVLEDGSLRASDNWQLGMPREVYMKSLLRHVMQAWTEHRRGAGADEAALEEALCAALFNTQGYLLELLRSRSGAAAK